MNEFIESIGTSRNLIKKLYSEYSVLFIDDDEDQRLLFEVLLRKAGLQIYTAESAETAFSMMTKRYFDIIITDLRMPEMSGFDVVSALRAVRTFPSTSRIPIVLLTACGNDLEKTALEIGADVFCEKKLARTELLPKIHALLMDA